MGSFFSWEKSSRHQHFELNCMPKRPVITKKYFYQYLWFRNTNKLLFYFEENKTYDRTEVAKWQIHER